MYVYFFLCYTSKMRSATWSKKKFDSKVMEYVNTLNDVQIEDYMKNGCMWTQYGLLIPVNDRVQALEVRKKVTALCRSVSTKCKPLHFSFLEDDNIDIKDLTAFGKLRT